MEHAFVSWSGGKDCCLAYYHTVINGLMVRFLVNMVTEDGHWLLEIVECKLRSKIKRSHRKAKKDQAAV